MVDVKARDDAARLYQIEVQLNRHPHLPVRMLYGWADLYSLQLGKGDEYVELKPTYAIWLLGENLLPASEDYLHDFQWRMADGRRLLAHGAIWIAELEKFPAREVGSEQEYRESDLGGLLNTAESIVPELRSGQVILQSWPHCPPMKSDKYRWGGCTGV